ncbi:MAG: aldose 1-epimerase family protein [Planctomycetaceae bacterium]|nr:aldose 1-epimerase family protein [Planctomycetaceae bacterium]
MPTWILTDTANDLYREDFHIGPGDLKEPTANFSVRKRTLRGGLRDGVEIIEVDNGALRLTIVPTRGMSLWKMWTGEHEIGWRSPVRGPVHPKFVQLDAPNGVGWLQGFDELLVRCGLESNGAPQFKPTGELEYPLHGRIGNLPAHQVEVTVDPERQEIRVSGEVDEGRLFGNRLRLKATYVTKFNSTRVGVIDEVTNPGAVPSELELLYHINVGHPLVTGGARVHCPVKKLVPRTPHAASLVKSWNEYPAPQPGVPEVVYFMELAHDAQGRTRALLEGAHGERGLSVLYRREQLPYFALWKAPQALEDGYVTGLEPTINWPNPRSFEKEHGRVATIAPGTTRRFEVDLEVHDTPAAVAQARRDVDALAKGITPQIFDQPQPDWCA